MLKKIVNVSYKFLSYRLIKVCLYSQNKFCFPTKPITLAIDESKLPPVTKIDDKTIRHLERLSLVDFGTKEGIKIVEEGIRFADQLHLVDTEHVKPMYTVLEEESCYLRDDEPMKDITREELLAHAAVTEEDYYVAPTGNIELVPIDGEALRATKKQDEATTNKSETENSTSGAIQKNAKPL